MIDEDVDRSQLLPHGLKAAGYIFGPGDVGRYRQEAAAGLLADLGGQFLQVVERSGEHGHTASLNRELPHQCCSQSRADTGDHSCFCH